MPQIYQVKSGDSLSKIARDVLGDMSRWPDIARLNNIIAPYTIFPGQTLQLPEPTSGPLPVAPPDREILRTPEATPAPAWQRALPALAIAAVAGYFVFFGGKR